MNTLSGYSKSTLTDNYLLSAGGGHIPLGNASGNVPLSNGAVNVNLRSEYARFLLGVTIDIEVAGDKETYYPVSIKFCNRKELPNTITIWKNLGSKTAAYEGNHSNGTSSMLYRYECRNNGWDGNQTYFKTLVASYTYAPLVAHTLISAKNDGLLIIWLRGGGTAYKISADYPITYDADDYTKSDVRICYETTNIGHTAAVVEVSPKIEIENAGIYSSGYFGYGNLYGNATTATTAVSANNVPVKQNTDTDAEWPIVWSNQNNDNSVTANLLYKSHGHFSYNPKNKRVTASLFKGNLEGNAATATYIKSGGRLACATTTDRALGLRFYEIYANGYPFSYGNVLQINGANGVGQLAMEWHGTRLAYRSAPDTSTTFTDWATLITDKNYTNYTVKKDGTGASGTWGINISGTATKATQDGNGKVIASTYLPLTGGTMTGVITTCTGNLKGLKFGNSYLTSLSNLLLWQSPEAIRFGSSDWDWNSWAGLKYDHPNKTIYLGLADNTIFTANAAQSGGKVRFPGVSALYMGSTNLTASTLNIIDTTGNKDLGMIVLGSAYRIGFIIGTGNVNRGIFDFTNQKWLLCKDASTTYITDWTGLGSSTKPVYFTGGKPVACTYSLNKTVPSDALFTDTKNTAGSTNSTSKMYLIGATSQAANPQTYSNSNIYATDGTLTTSGVGKDGYMAYPKDGYYSGSLNSETGYLCITLPLSWTDTMIKFDVNIFNYLNHTSVTYTISGYMYSPTKQWYNVAAYAVGHHLGGLSNLPVIFGHNGTKCVVYIGTATTTWAYPKIAISNITLGWSNTTTDMWSTGWSFAFTTSLGTYNANVQNTNVGYLSQLLQGKSAADFTGKYSWECTVNRNAWSRLCLVKYSLSHSGASYILNVLEHRTSVVYNYTYLVNTHHEKKGHITLLNNSDFAYSGDAEARLVVDTYGNSYFEFRDGTRLSDSWTSATVKCELIPLSTGDITKYTSYTSGSSIPSDYAVATTVLHTGEGIPNIDNYWKNAYNYNISKTLNAPSSSSTFNSSNTSEVLLAETTFSTVTTGMTINLSFSGLIKAWEITSGFSKSDCTQYYNQNNLLKFVYYVYVDGVCIGSYQLGQSYLALVVNSGTSIHVAIKAKLNRNFTTNTWWHCASPCDFYINSSSIGIKSAEYITVKATATGAGNVLRNSEYVLYKNGFVFSDINSNSLTYCDKNQVIFKRGGICFKLDSSGLTQSINSGLSWSPVTGMVTPL